MFWRTGNRTILQCSGHTDAGPALPLLLPGTSAPSPFLIFFSLRSLWAHMSPPCWTVSWQWCLQRLRVSWSGASQCSQVTGTMVSGRQVRSCGVLWSSWGVQMFLWASNGERFGREVTWYNLCSGFSMENGWREINVSEPESFGRGWIDGLNSYLVCARALLNLVSRSQHHRAVLR